MLSYTPTSLTKPKFTLLPEGEYRFRVDRAMEATSSRGNSQIILHLDLIDDFENKIAALIDYLVFDVPKAEWKINQFMASVGLHPGTTQEKVAVDPTSLIGVSGKLLLGHKAPNSEGKVFYEVTEYLFDARPSTPNRF